MNFEKNIDFSHTENQTIFTTLNNQPCIALKMEDNYLFECIFYNSVLNKDKYLLNSLPNHDTKSTIQCKDKIELTICHQAFFDLIKTGYSDNSWLIALDLGDIQKFFSRNKSGRFYRYSLDTSEFEKKQEEIKSFMSEIKNSDVFIFIQQPDTFEKLYDTLELAQDSLDNTVRNVLCELSTTEKSDNKIIISVWAFYSTD